MFARQRSIVVSDKSLINLRDFLLDFFGEDFFRVRELNLKTVTMKAEEVNWFFQLLANDDYPSLVHLYEIKQLLSTSKALHPSLFKVLQSTSRRQNFRDYLFEAVIHELLRINDLAYESKPVIDGREKEGFILLNGEKCLFECKKLYSSQLPGIGFIFSLQDDFFRKWQKRPFPVNAYISAYPSTEPKFRKNKKYFFDAFTNYLNQVGHTGNVYMKQEIKDESGKTIGEIFFEANNEPIFRHQLELIKGPAVCFRINPPTRKMINEQMMDYHSTKLHIKFEQMESLSIDFLLEQIRKKRYSQRDMIGLPRIFFFDNEVFRGFEIPMFPSSGRFDGSKIQEYLELKQTDDIVVLVFREYGGNELPRWIFKVYCKPSLSRFKILIENWKTLYHDSDFLLTLPRPLASN